MLLSHHQSSHPALSPVPPCLQFLHRRFMQAEKRLTDSDGRESRTPACTHDSSAEPNAPSGHSSAR